MREFGTAELWAQHSDRLARGDGRIARHVVEIGLWALKRDVIVRTVQDPETFRDLLYAVVTGQRNHEDSRRKGAAMSSGRRRAAARGEFIGYRPDGYVLEIELRDGEIKKQMVLDPDRQEIIETIFRMALRGRPTGAIARRLNDQGWLTNPRRKDAMPQRWRVHHVDAVLRNRRYAGLAVFGGEVVGRGHWPVYISEAQHERLKRRMLRHTKNTREKKPLRLETYLLAGLLRCGCGEPLYCTAGNKRKEGARARRYVCASHDKDRHAARCTARRLGADMLEAMFVASLRRLLGEGQDDEQSVISPDPARIFDLSLERAELRGAAMADDQAAFGATFERLLRRVASQASAWDEEGASRRRVRQLEAVTRFETWAEQEANERTDATRAEAVELNKLLRAWFTSATVLTQATTIRITATRRPPAGAPVPPLRVQVEFDRVDWTFAACEKGRSRLRYEAWDDCEIIASFQLWAQRHGRSPFWQEWRFAGPSWPTSLTVKRHFGSWAEALRRAGLESHIPATRHKFQRWSDAELIQAIVDWTDQYGHPPKWEDWICATETRPCCSTITERFGGWRAGMAAAGVTC